jgi:ferrous iron transport protein B
MDCCNNKPSLLEKLRLFLSGNREAKGQENTFTKKVALIGNPNVGKSVIFNSLTGAYVTVSNYPGTTVEISKGWYSTGKEKLEIIDTPGMYSIMPITEEERVTRNLLLVEKPELVIHVIDAKNIERMLPLTLQLKEAGFEVILVLNIMDEARSLGIRIHCMELGKQLGIPVVEASAALNIGIHELKATIKEQVANAA